jgi:hypothetical protein
MSTATLSCMISIVIQRPWQEVYRFVAQPENLAAWATGLGRGIRRVQDAWQADGPEGPVRICFCEPNDLGVLDHWVYPDEDTEIYIPMRVIANGDAAELMFTLFRQPGVSDEKFAEDEAWVLRDLANLKSLLEAHAA